MESPVVVGFPKRACSLIPFSVIHCQRAADICTQMPFAISLWEQRVVPEIIFILWEIICWDHAWTQLLINSFVSEASKCWSIHHSHVGIKLLLSCPYDHFLHVKYEAVNRVWGFSVTDFRWQCNSMVGRDIWELECLFAVPDAVFDFLPDLFTAQYFSFWDLPTVMHFFVHLASLDPSVTRGSFLSCL